MHLFRRVIEDSSMGDYAHVLNGILYFCASLLELVNGHEKQIKYIVVKYPKGISQNPS